MTPQELAMLLFRVAYMTWGVIVVYAFFCDMSKSEPGLVGRWEKPDLLAPLVEHEILSEQWAERLYLVWNIAYLCSIIFFICAADML